MSTDKIMQFEITPSVDGPKEQRLMEILKPLRAHINHICNIVKVPSENISEEVIAMLQNNGLRLIDGDTSLNEIS